MPLLGSEVVVQFPVPIFSANATGFGSANVMETVLGELGVGVGVGAGVAPALLPQPVEMIIKEANNTTTNKDLIIRNCLVDTCISTQLKALKHFLPDATRC